MVLQSLLSRRMVSEEWTAVKAVVQMNYKRQNDGMLEAVKGGEACPRACLRGICVRICVVCTVGWVSKALHCLARPAEAFIARSSFALTAFKRMPRHH